MTNSPHESRVERFAASDPFLRGRLQRVARYVTIGSVRLRRILFRLQEATHPGSADAPGFRLHPLKGNRAGEWSVRVSGNWRVVFRFENGEAVDVNLID